VQRQRAVQAKLDRGYEDYLESRISEGFWTRKSQEWETESATIEREIGRLSRPAPAIVATGEKILELAKQAEFLYKTQSPVEQRRLLETVLSNCTFDRGSLCPTYAKPFDLLAQGHETGNWRREWDSNSLGPFRICNLQILRCQDCQELPPMPRTLARHCTAGLLPALPVCSHTRRNGSARRPGAATRRVV
jgi:hypothetical protein